MPPVCLYAAAWVISPSETDFLLIFVFCFRFSMKPLYLPVVWSRKMFSSFVNLSVCLASGCPPGWFGAGCGQRCNCSNGGVCDSATGNCTCGLGWTGPHCEKGLTLLHLLIVTAPIWSAVDDKAKHGDSKQVNGFFILFICLSECPGGRFGANCHLKCNCQNNGTCDRVTGTCQCGAGYYGQHCEHGENRK